MVSVKMSPRAECICSLVVLLLSPKVIALYKDYESQMKEKKDPYYNPDKLTWDGVDTEMWKDINKKYIEKDK